MEEPASSGAAGEPQSAGAESGQPGAGGGPDDTVERSGPSALVPRILARPPRKAKPQGVRVLEPKESMRNRLRKALAPYLTATYWQGEMARKFTAEYIEAHPPPEDEDDLPAYIAQHLRELNRVTERWSGCVVKALDPLSHQMAIDDRLQRQRQRAEGLPVESLDMDFAMRPGLSPAATDSPTAAPAAKAAQPPAPPPRPADDGDTRLTSSQIVSAVHLVSDIKVWEEILAAKKAEERRQHAIAELHLHHAARIIQRSWRSFIGQRKEEKARLDSLVSPDVQAMLSAAAYKAMRDARNKLQLTRLRKSLSRRARVGGFGSSAPRDLDRTVKPQPGGGGGPSVGPNPPAGRRPPKAPAGPRGAAAVGGEARRSSRDVSGAPSGSRSALDSAGGADSQWEGDGREQADRGSSAGGDSALAGGLSRSASRRTGSANSGRGLVRASSSAARSAQIFKRLVSLKGDPQEGSLGRGGSDMGGGGALQEGGEGEGGEGEEGWTEGVPRPAAGRYAAAEGEEEDQGDEEEDQGDEEEGGNFDDMQPEPLPEGEEGDEEGDDGEWEEADEEEDREEDADGEGGEAALQGLLRPEDADQAVAEAEEVVEMAAALAEAFLGGLGEQDQEGQGDTCEADEGFQGEEGEADPGASATAGATQEEAQVAVGTAGAMAAAGAAAAGAATGPHVPSAPKAPRPPARGEAAARAPAPRRGGRTSALSMSSDTAAMRHVIAGALAAAAAPVLGRSGALAVARLGLGEPLAPPHRLSGAGGSTGNLAGGGGLPASTGALAASGASRRAVLGTAAPTGLQPQRVGRLRAGAGSPGADRVSGSGAGGHPKALTPSAIRAEAEAGLMAAAAGGGGDGLDDSGLVSADWAAAAASAAAAAGAALVSGGSSSGPLGPRASGYSSSSLAGVHLEPLGPAASPRASGSGAAALMRSPRPSDSGAGGIPQALSPAGMPDPLLAQVRLPRQSDGAAPSSPSPLPPLPGTHMATGDDAVGGLTGTAAARHQPQPRVSATGQAQGPGAGPGEALDVLSSPQASPTGHLGGAAPVVAGYQQQWAMPRQPQPPLTQQRTAAPPTHHHPQSHYNHAVYHPPPGAATMASALPDPRNVTAPGAVGAAAAAAHKDPSWLLPPIAGSPSRSATGPPGLGAQAAAVAALRAGARVGGLAAGVVGVSRTASDPFMQRPHGLVAQQQQQAQGQAQAQAQGQPLGASHAGAASSALGGPASPGLASRANLGQGAMAAAASGQRARRSSLVGGSVSGGVEGPLGALISLSSGVVGPSAHGGASPVRLAGRAARSSVGSPGMLPAPSPSQLQVQHNRLTVSVDSSSYPHSGSVSLMGVAGSGLLINGISGGGASLVAARGAGGDTSPPLVSSQLKGGGGAAGGAGAARQQQVHAGRR